MTQATLSRDIRDLGLVKAAADGAYKRPQAGEAAVAGPDAAAPCSGASVAGSLRKFDVVQQLVVLRTESAQAQPLAEAIDRAQAAGGRRHDRRREHDPRDLPRGERRRRRSRGSSTSG